MILPALLGVLLAACATTRIIDYPSANQNGRVRFLVLHYTDGSFERSLELLSRAHVNPVSAHYLVGRAGEYASRTPPVLRLVDETQRAWHAGPSRWQGRENLNDTSIGIEIVYESHCGRTPGETVSPWIADLQCDYADYPADQIAAVEQLARDILARHPDIDATRVVGHSDIQPENKTDPGPRFPWRMLAQHGIGAWPDEAEVARYRDHFDARPPAWPLARRALLAYGYGVPDVAADDTRARNVVNAFQSHFLPAQRSGDADALTVATLLALLDKYRHAERAALAREFPELPAAAAPPPASP
jgi:N-acetyl-anhydromuramyl-L-alanine amidase AmpD